jgi:hypothetical protein
MNIFVKLSGCTARMTHISPMGRMGPVSPVRPLELNQRPGEYLWTPLSGAVTHLNALLTERKSNGLSNARFSKINVH